MKLISAVVQLAQLLIDQEPDASDEQVARALDEAVQFREGSALERYDYHVFLAVVRIARTLRDAFRGGD